MTTTTSNFIKKTYDIMIPVSVLVTIIAACVGITWFFVAQDKRIATLENQMQSIVTQTPTPMQSSVTQFPGNPLVNTCSDLASRAAQAIEQGSPTTVASPIAEMMNRLGCYSILNAKK
ncbi:hypothetical protein [Solidesulfovibrio carbinolicus]|uniref:hypothetical protein n=1 Tax=Solidesulfovibrio carbinolicus TaxID=296842 RepID=UPI001010DA34|nr:hypothetical protein [Solidesulfovibrio carbinolicus]